MICRDSKIFPNKQPWLEFAVITWVELTFIYLFPACVWRTLRWLFVLKELLCRFQTFTLPLSGFLFPASYASDKHAGIDYLPLYLLTHLAMERDGLLAFIGLWRKPFGYFWISSVEILIPLLFMSALSSLCDLAWFLSSAFILKPVSLSVCFCVQYI